MILGTRRVGSDTHKSSQNIIVLHDWFSDCSSYNDCIPYLDLIDRSYYFVDLRGYGRSIDCHGDYTVEEVAADVIETVTDLGLEDYHLVGYSMTGLVGHLVCYLDNKRINTFTAVCPVSAFGMPETSSDIFEFMIDAAGKNDVKAAAAVHMMTSSQHTDPFAEFKVKHWRRVSTASARMGYCRMFVKTDLSKTLTKMSTPTQVICTEYDNENHQKIALIKPFDTFFNHVIFTNLSSAGHYPMQERPVSFADTLNRWFDDNK